MSSTISAVVVSLRLDRLPLLVRELTVVLEEHPDVTAMRTHQVEQVDHHGQQSFPGRGGGASPVLFDQEIDELLVDREQDLVLPREVVIERRLADSRGLGDRRHVRGVVARAVEQVGGPRDDLAAPSVGVDTGRHRPIVSTDWSVDNLGRRKESFNGL